MSTNLSFTGENVTVTLLEKPDESTLAAKDGVQQ
jgi:hypothetical protein